MSFVERLYEARSIMTPSHPWIPILSILNGTIGHDGVARIATDAIFEQLDLPPFKRTPEAAKQIKHIMLQLGWTPVRARSLTARGRAARVRGYARMPSVS